MHPDVRNLPLHMRQLADSLLGYALHHSIYWSYVRHHEAIGVLHAAQAVEIILKSCIANEHPLLIFTHLPRPSDDRPLLNLPELMSDGRTLMFDELPGALWASTGYRIPHPEKYRQFGRLRNQIQHLAVPTVSLQERTIDFLVNIADPVIQRFWNTNLFDHLQDYDPDAKHLIEFLDKHHVQYDGWVPILERDEAAPEWSGGWEPWIHRMSNVKVWAHRANRKSHARVLSDAEFHVTPPSGRIDPATVETTWKDYSPRSET